MGMKRRDKPSASSRNMGNSTFTPASWLQASPAQALPHYDEMLFPDNAAEREGRAV